MEQASGESTNATTAALETADIRLDRDVFMRTLIRELSGTLEDVVGLEEASGFVSVVGQAVGQTIDRRYKDALGEETFTRPHSEDDDKIVTALRAVRDIEPVFLVALDLHVVKPITPEKLKEVVAGIAQSG